MRVSAAIVPTASEIDSVTTVAWEPVNRPLQCLVMHDADDLPSEIARIREQSRFDLEFTVTRTVSDTREALDHLEPDLLMLDQVVPDGDGLDFARDLMRDARTCGLPIIMLGTEDAEAQALDILRAGAADCISTRSVTLDRFDQAIENALRRSKRDAADHLAVISNLESENATLRRVSLRNMRLLKSEALPLLSFAWQSLKDRDASVPENKRMARNLSRLTRTMMGLIDDTVITSATHRALDVPGPVDLRAVAQKIVDDDCGELRVSSAHFNIMELPVLFAREPMIAMLFEELFLSMVRNAKLGHVCEIEVGSGLDPDGNSVVWLTDNGVPLSVRKQILAQKNANLNDLGAPRQDSLSWSLCQRLAEKNGGEFRILETDAGQIRISMRFPADMVSTPELE